MIIIMITTIIIIRIIIIIIRLCRQPVCRCIRCHPQTNAGARYRAELVRAGGGELHDACGLGAERTPTPCPPPLRPAGTKCGGMRPWEVLRKMGPACLTSARARQPAHLGPTGPPARQGLA